jgi:hypothetical protein
MTSLMASRGPAQSTQPSAIAGDDLTKGRAEVGLAVVQTFFADDVHGNPQPPRGVDRMLPSAFTKFFHDCSLL